jgi:hypothetical protein
VHGDIHVAGNEGAIERGREKARALDLGQRHVGDRIARGHDLDEGHVQPGRVLYQGRRDVPRLPERQGAPARADADGGHCAAW